MPENDTEIAAYAAACEFMTTWVELQSA